MKTLELFCGTKSFSKIAKEYSCSTITSDIDERFSPDIVSNVFDLNFEKGQFDIIWASPPCEGFSIASMGHHWNRDDTPKTDVAAKSLEIICKTIEIIKEVQPKYWFIENPRGKLRKVINLPKTAEFGATGFLGTLDCKRETVCYCRYGDTRMKPTDIWTNAFEWKPIDRMCANGNPDHEKAPRGSKTGTQGLKDYETRSIIPSELFVEIFTQI